MTIRDRRVWRWVIHITQRESPLSPPPPSLTSLPVGKDYLPPTSHRPAEGGCHRETRETAGRHAGYVLSATGETPHDGKLKRKVLPRGRLRPRQPPRRRYFYSFFESLSLFLLCDPILLIFLMFWQPIFRKNCTARVFPPIFSKESMTNWS